MSTSLRTLEDIPSISSLYRKKDLRPAVDDDLPTPNPHFNNKICTIQGDITVLQIDAIVNAANSGLRGGGGVDGAIQRAAGPELLRECGKLGGCATGSAKITDAYNLPCKKVIHAVGPIFRDRDHSEPLLRGAYRKSLSLAVENDLKTIAFPAISTGVYGYPSDAAASAALREVRDFLSAPDGEKLDKVIFCNFMDKDVAAYAKWIPSLFPPTKDDLSETGECALPESVAPKDDLPTDDQKTPQEISESNQKSLDAGETGLDTQGGDPGLDESTTIESEPAAATVSTQSVTPGQPSTSLKKRKRSSDVSSDVQSESQAQKPVDLPELLTP